jgi:predicted phosphodiesterase
MWETPEGESYKGCVKYGTDSSMNMTSSVITGHDIPGEGCIHELTLSGLKPFTKYYYSPGNGKEFSSEINVTKTAPLPGTNFAIMSLSDIHENDNGIWQSICNSNLTGTDVVVLIGDLVDDGSKRLEWNKGFFTPGENLLKQFPIISVVGNHETAFGPTTFYDYFALPVHEANGETPEAYFSTDYGDVKIIGINSNGDNFSPSITSESLQHSWLDNQLKNADSKWIFIFSHTNVLSTSYHGQWSEYEKENLMPLYEKYAAAGKHIIVFGGDEHNFEHLYKNGVNYFRPGCANLMNRDTGLNLADKPYSIYFSKTPGYSTINITDSGNTVIINAKKPDGEIFYTKKFSLEVK